jgi:hypothetical protein
MVRSLRPGRLLAGAAVLSLTSFVPVEVAQATPSGSVGMSQGAAAESCAPLVDFRSRNFPGRVRIDNEYLPMVSGTRLTYEGVASSGGGSAEEHQVVFTVTDLTKVVDGVPTRVIYDLDLSAGEVAEAELAFFAQDRAGNVWNLGEYPEEFENGSFAQAPDVWIAGLRGASAGIHMPAEAEDLVRGPEYLQGDAPAIDFLDCAQVAQVDRRVTVPAGSFRDVLTTHERSPLESDAAIQVKDHAPNVGIVRIGAINDPENETLVLTKVEHLRPEQRAAVDIQAIKLDIHGRRVSNLYRQTAHLRVSPDRPAPHHG